MTAGDASTTPDDHDTSHDPKLMQAIIPGSLVVENSSQMTMFEKSSDDIILRRMKNRERQRRYRAKKRLEAEMKKSCLIELRSTLPTGPHCTDTNYSFQPCRDHVITTPSITPRVHCARKWKKDARQAHASREPEDPSTTLLVPARLSSEVELNLEQQTNSSGRRHWKAEARSKMDSGNRETVDRTH